MNNDQLNELLKSARVPERPADYWNDFPGEVRRHLQREPATAPSAPRRAGWLPGYAWAASLATACVVLGFVLGFWRGHHSPAADPQFAAAEKLYRESEGLFRHQIRAIVFDTDGPRLVLADRPNVPDSTPYYVTVCGPQGCHSFVTFSGQQVQVNGQTCEVLADGSGRLLLVNDHGVWSENDSTGPVRVAAKRMSTTL